MRRWSVGWRGLVLMAVLLACAAGCLMAGCNSWAVYRPNEMKGPSVEYERVGEGGGGRIVIQVTEDANGDWHVLVPRAAGARGGAR